MQGTKAYRKHRQKLDAQERKEKTKNLNLHKSSRKHYGL